MKGRRERLTGGEREAEDVARASEEGGSALREEGVIAGGQRFQNLWKLGEKSTNKSLKEEISFSD